VDAIQWPRDKACTAHKISIRRITPHTSKELWNASQVFSVWWTAQQMLITLLQMMNIMMSIVKPHNRLLGGHICCVTLHAVITQERKDPESQNGHKDRPCQPTNSVKALKETGVLFPTSGQASSFLLPPLDSQWKGSRSFKPAIQRQHHTTMTARWSQIQQLQSFFQFCHTVLTPDPIWSHDQWTSSHRHTAGTVASTFTTAASPLLYKEYSHFGFQNTRVTDHMHTILICA